MAIWIKLSRTSAQVSFLPPVDEQRDLELSQRAKFQPPLVPRFLQGPLLAVLQEDWRVLPRSVQLAR